MEIHGVTLTDGTTETTEIETIHPKELLSVIESFYLNPRSPEIIVHQAQAAMGELRKQGSLSGAILGFPSYIGSDPLREPMREIISYVRSKTKLASGNETYPCPRCYNENLLTDPRSACKACFHTEFKPRVFQQIAPDIDLFAVVPSSKRENLMTICAALEEQGYIPSDFDIGASMSQVLAACGDPGEIPFPLDLHVTDAASFQQWVSGYDPDRAETWKMPIVNWYGVDLGKQVRFFGPGTVSTMMWLNQLPEIEEAIRGVAQKVYRWATAQMKGKEPDAPQIIFDYLVSQSDQLRGLARQPYLRERVKFRIRENLGLL